MYRLYFLDDKGVIQACEDFTAPDDNVALGVSAMGRRFCLARLRRIDYIVRRAAYDLNGRTATGLLRVVAAVAAVFSVSSFGLSA